MNPASNPVSIEHIEVYGFSAALRGMRNAMESWEKSDTAYNHRLGHIPVVPPHGPFSSILSPEHPDIGQNDLNLACKLIRSGNSSERKFLRMIWVWADVTLPLNVWNELDTYKVSTTRNSCSTMHKLGSRPLTFGDFADGGLEEGELDQQDLDKINALGDKLRSSKGADRVKWLRRIRRRLPWGHLQRSTYNFNYETALKIYFDRRNHRLEEWSDKFGLCAFILSLPYMHDFIEAAESVA